MTPTLPRTSGRRMRAGGRIAIVGAGPAGLAAAHALRRRGQVAVVFESSGRVGGKCRTVEVDGRTYEMGATILFPTFRHVRRLMREVGLRGTRVRLEGAYVEAGGARTATMAPARRDTSWPDVLAAMARLGVQMLRHRRLLRPGFAGVHPELSVPFSQWAQSQRLEVCARYYEPWFTGFGYGYFRDMPAAYALKYVSLVRPLVYDVVDGGFQALWERVASGIDVRLGSEIRRIERADGVTVHTSDGRHEFDELILASPLDEALTFLDADPEEAALLSRLRHHCYVTTLAAVEGPLLPRWGFFMDNFAPDRRGHPMFWYRRWPDRALVTFFTLVDPDRDRAQVEGAIEAELRRLGRGLGRVRAQEVWQRYCPHVGPEDIAAGWFDRMDRLQGRRDTFYTGEALSFGLVECAAAYSRNLVERFHPPRGTSRSAAVLES